MADNVTEEESLQPALSRRQSFRPQSRAARARWWLSVTIAVVAPFLLSGVIGYRETWDAFDRYQAALLQLPETHALRVPSPADRQRTSYTRLDADLTAWHAGMQRLYDRISQMMVVGNIQNSDSGIEFEFTRQAGASLREVKGRFHAQRDVALLAYFLLSAWAYFSDSVPLALVVANLNLFNIAVCMRLKGLSDGFTKAVEQVQDAESDFLMLPLESGLVELQQQALVLAKMRSVVGAWEGTQLGYRQPVIHSLTLSVSIMISLAAATTLRSLHVIAYGFWPRLPRLSWARLAERVLFFGTRQSTAHEAAALLEKRAQRLKKRE